MRGYLNVLTLNSVRYTLILSIKNKINKVLKEVFGDISYKDKNKEGQEIEIERNILDILKEFFKGDKYNKIILNYLKNMFFQIYKLPVNIENILIDRTTFNIRNNENTFKKFDIDLKNFKFLKIMENENYMEKLEECLSYKLGKEVAKIDETRKTDRANLEKFVKTFSGSITRKIKTLDNVKEHVNEIFQRLNQNELYIKDCSDFKNIIEQENINNFNKTNFILGYFIQKYSYNQNDKNNDKSSK